MSKPVAFTREAAVEMIATVHRVRQMSRRDMAGEKNRALPQETSFWAYLSSPGGLNGLFWSWVKVQPVANPPSANDPWTIEDVPLWEFAQPQVAGWENAREANGNRSVPPGSVVLLTFLGYDKVGEPLYVFQYAGAQQDEGIVWVHDHRDNAHGGYTFAVLHPGTSLPQQPWHV